MKKFIFTIIILIVAILLAAPSLTGKYVEKILQERIETLYPLVKVTNYQRGYFQSQVEIAQGKHFSQISITHAPLTLTGLDLARGFVKDSTKDIQFQLNWQRVLTAKGEVTIEGAKFNGESHGKIEGFPQTSVTTLTAQLPPTNGITYSPFQATVSAQNGTVEFLIPKIYIKQADRFALTAENVQRKDINAGGNEFKAQKVFINIPSVDLDLTWKNIVFSDRIQTAPDGQTLSYSLRFSGEQEQFTAGGAMRFVLDPLRPILPDSIVANLTINGINKNDRDLFFRSHWQEDELLKIVKKNLATEKMSADLQADLLRLGKGIKINLHLEENIGLTDEVELFPPSQKSLAPLFVGSWLNVEISDSIIENRLIRSFMGPNPQLLLVGLGFFHDQENWYLHAKIGENGSIEYQQEKK